MKKYIVAFDAGTTSCRAILVDMEANVLDIQQKEFSQHFPHPAWVEHDPEEIWETQKLVFETLLSKNTIGPEEILAIGITNQRETTVVWERNSMQAVYNAIVWQDRRTSAYCDKIKSQGFDKYIYENTGLVTDAYFSGTKLRWILNNVDGAREKAESGELLFGTIDTWLIYKMTDGKAHVTDFTNASRSLMYNIREHAWDDKILEFLDVPKSMLPTVKNASDDFGVFEYNGVSIPITGVAGDQQAALFGQACFTKGMAKNTYGTGCFMLMHVGDDFVQSKNGLLTTLCCNADGRPAYALEGSVFIAGAAIQWLRDGLKIIPKASDSEPIAKSVEEDELVVVPAFVGLGAPYWDSTARGAIFGLTRDSSDKHLIKATLDSLAYQTRDVLDAMEKDAGTEMNILKVDGGAAKNNYLMQLQSDILDANVERPENIESTAMGAAYLAGMYAGAWTADKIIENRRVEKTFTPNMSAETRNQKYTRWQKAVSRTKDWNSE